MQTRCKARHLGGYASNLLLTAALVLHARSITAQAPAAPTPCIVGIDHIPVVVKDLASVEETYRCLGFSLKSGRPHQNGIRNAHVKFPDGAGIELITASEPTDALARHYVEALKQGEGPTDFALHARDTAKLTAALTAAGYGFEQRDGFISLKEPTLSFLFFVQDNRSPTDRPEHFAHQNEAVAMTDVYLAPDDPAPIGKLLRALGATESKQISRDPPLPKDSVVYTVENGHITVLPRTCQNVAGRPVIAAVFETRDFAVAQACLRRAENSRAVAAVPQTVKPRWDFAPPWICAGIQLEFCEQP